MIRLRAARPDERRHLEELQRRASLGNPSDRAAIEANPDAIELPLSQILSGDVYVAEQNGDVAGFCVVLRRADGDAELDGLFVEPERQGTGIGRMLVDSGADVARSRGAVHLHVIANPRAEKFYERCGFRRLGEIATRFGPALQMRFDLRPSLGVWLADAARSIQRSQSPRLDARVLAKWALRLDDAGLIAQEARPLSAEERKTLDAALERRIAGEPVAYITGEKEFWGLTIQCRPPMLLPRPDSETLIAAAVKRRNKAAALRILDLGTGTGCLLVAALTEFPAAEGVGVDYSLEAVALARDNVRALGLSARASLQQGSWTDGVEGKFDLILANPPYIPESESGTLDPGIVDFEDPRALFAGSDGLSAYRAIFADAPRLLAPQGLMIVELGSGQADAVSALAAAAFPGAVIARDPDLGGRPRALIADCAEKTV